MHICIYLRNIYSTHIHWPGQFELKMLFDHSSSTTKGFFLPQIHISMQIACPTAHLFSCLLCSIYIYDYTNTCAYFCIWTYIWLRLSNIWTLTSIGFQHNLIISREHRRSQWSEQSVLFTNIHDQLQRRPDH